MSLVELRRSLPASRAARRETQGGKWPSDYEKFLTIWILRASQRAAKSHEYNCVGENSLEIAAPIFLATYKELRGDRRPLRSTVGDVLTHKLNLT